MNLIERLGGYERAKHEFEMIKEMKPIHPGEIETNDRLLLEYRRQHNIFEVGDKVVRRNGIEYEIHKIELVDEYDLKIFSQNMSHSYWVPKGQLRHAEPEEIKAGKRLEVNDG